MGLRKISVQVSANGCLKLKVDIIGLRENCADVQAGHSYKAFKLEEWIYSFLPPIQSILKQKFASFGMTRLKFNLNIEMSVKSNIQKCCKNLEILAKSSYNSLNSEYWYAGLIGGK